jgi:hypothetical protein
MLEILKSFLVLLTTLALSIWDVVYVMLTGLWEILLVLHTTAPRLEGLLVGITLAWLMARRDRHPLLRVLSAPLKLVVDILDLAWDQATEVISDLWDTAWGWVKGSLGWAWGKVVTAYEWALGKLVSLKDRLVSKSE